MSPKHWHSVEETMPLNQHGTCVSFNDYGVLLIGPPGCGKSSLAMQLIQYGAMLVADDQVHLQPSAQGWLAFCPEILQGKIHYRDKIAIVDFLPAKKLDAVFVSPMPSFPLSQPPALGFPVFNLDFLSENAVSFITETLARFDKPGPLA